MESKEEFLHESKDESLIRQCKRDSVLRYLFMLKSETVNVEEEICGMMRRQNSRQGDLQLLLKDLARLEDDPNMPISLRKLLNNDPNSGNLLKAMVFSRVQRLTKLDSLESQILLAQTGQQSSSASGPSMGARIAAAAAAATTSSANVNICNINNSSRSTSGDFSFINQTNNNMFEPFIPTVRGCVGGGNVNTDLKENAPMEKKFSLSSFDPLKQGNSPRSKKFQSSSFKEPKSPASDASSSGKQIDLIWFSPAKPAFHKSMDPDDRIRKVFAASTLSTSNSMIFS